MSEKTSGLVTAYIFDGKGGGKKIDWAGVNAWDASQGLLWVHLDYSKPDAVKWLNTHSRLAKPIRQSLMIEESRPRTVIEPDGLLLFLRGVNLNPGQDPEDMVSVRIWAEKNRIITARRRRILSLQDLEESIRANQAPKDISEFLAVLCDRLTNRISDVVEDITDGTDQLEEDLSMDTISKIRFEVSEFRRQSIMLRRYMAPQREAFNRLLVAPEGVFNPSDLVIIREASDRVQRYIEDLDAVRDRAAVIQEEISTRLSEQINGRMYLLSLVAVIFLPMGFITGLLGINVGGIPGSQYNHAFWIVLGFLLLLGVGLILIFRRKRWM